MTHSRILYANLGREIQLSQQRCYVQYSPINVTGFGITNHFLETQEAFGIDQLYQQQNLSGFAVGGQYIHLNVPDHLKSVFLKDFHVTLDPEHGINSQSKNTTSNDKEKQSSIRKVSDTV